MPDLLPLLAVLLLGVLVAFLRARNAQERVSRLEAQMMAIEHRLRGLQEQLGRGHEESVDGSNRAEENAAPRPEVAAPSAESRAAPPPPLDRLTTPPPFATREGTGDPP